MTTINLTEGTSNCVSTKITKQTSENLDQCVVEVPFTFSISIGDELNVYDKDSTLLFKGLVQNIKIGGVKEVSVYDYGIQLMDTNINEIYSSQKAEDIIESIVTGNTDLTYVSTIVTSTPITTLIVKDKRGWDVVNELCELLNASFRVDKNKTFYLELSEEDASSEIITTTNAFIDGEWDQNSDNLVNKVTIIGDKQLFEKTETFNGTGVEDTFTLSEFPVDINVSVGGVELTGYVEGASTIADYSLDKATKDVIFESGSIPAIGTDNVVIRYTFSIDIKLVSQDDASITAYGGTNKRAKEKKITKPYITSFQEARRYANYYLSTYAEPLLSSKWIINDYSKFENFVPNQIINIQDTIRNIDDNFIIKKVEREFPGKLIVEVGWREDDILDWAKETQYRIKQLEEVDDNSTILQEYGFIQNKALVTVTTEVTRQLQRTLPTNYLYLFNDIENLEFYATLNNTLYDRSTNNATLTWSGTSSYTTGYHYSYSAEFDGTNYIEMDSTTTISKTKGLISLWFYPTQEQYSGIFKLGTNTPSIYQIDDMVGIVWQGATGLPLDDEYMTETLINLNDWNHILLYWEDGVTIAWELNGVAIESAVPTLSTIVEDITTTPDYGFIGRMSDPRVYSDTFTSTIRSLFWNGGIGLNSNANISEVGGGEYRRISTDMNGLYTWLKLDGDVLDSLDTNNATVQIATSGTESYATGLQYTEAFNFVGISDGSKYTEGAYIQFGANIDMAKNAHSLSFWYKTSSSYFQMLFIQALNSASGTIEFKPSDNTISVESTSNNVWDKSFSTGIDIDDGEWHHYCIVFSATDTKLYVDKVLSDTQTANSDTLSYFRYRNIGGYGNTSFTYGEMPTGVVADVRIINDISDELEVEALYNEGLGIIDNAYNPLPDDTLGDRFILPDKTQWGTPDYEIAETGTLQSWEDIV